GRARAAEGARRVSEKGRHPGAHGHRLRSERAGSEGSCRQRQYLPGGTRAASSDSNRRPQETVGALPEPVASIPFRSSFILKKGPSHAAGQSTTARPPKRCSLQQAAETTAIPADS